MQPGETDYVYYSSFRHAYSSPGDNPPWGRDRVFYWDVPPDISFLLRIGSVPQCYGVVWNLDSIQKARSQMDLCQLEVASVEECAPGCTASSFADDLCSAFKDCKTEFERMTSRWASFAGANVSQPNENQTFELPVGWNSADDLRRSLLETEEFVEGNGLITGPWFWFVLHVTLLGIASAGWIFVVVGLIAGFLPLGQAPTDLMSESILESQAPSYVEPVSKS
jgi:hypothetical protein